LKTKASPETGSVVLGAEGIFGWTVSVFNALIHMMFFSTFNATEVVIAIVLSMAKNLAIMALW